MYSTSQEHKGRLQRSHCNCKEESNYVTFQIKLLTFKTTPCLQNEQFSQTAWMRAWSTTGLCKSKKWTFHFTAGFTSSGCGSIFHGSNSAEFAFEKPHCIYEASLRVQHSCCNIFLRGSKLQHYFEGISDQVYQSKQGPQNRLVDWKLFALFAWLCLY